jgi:hypothetical protein
MTFGFIIIRHVNSKITDYYWKECYTCIRKFYINPIIIIDDSSIKEYLNENIFLKNCTIIYDTEHKGAGEILPYYYFHKLKPFDTAVVIHDSIFIQSKIDFSESDNVRFFWSFRHVFDDDLIIHIHNLCKSMSHGNELINLYNQKHLWNGCFGTMSVINWNFLDRVNKYHSFFDSILPIINNREYRSALERLFALVMYFNDPNIKSEYFGDIHRYIRWGISFFEYLTNNFNQYPLMKVWSGR